MIKHLKKLLFPVEEKKEEKKNTGSDKIKMIQVATCALFIEMANADDDFTEEEKEKIISIMQKTFNIEKDYVEELIELSNQRTKESVSIYEFTTEINKSFNRDEKYELLKNLWRLIYTDNELNAYEDRLIKRIGGTINMEHQEIIGAKLEVKKELNNKSK